MPPDRPSRKVRGNTFTALATGGVLFAVILGGFTGYAFLSRATYRTSALVQLEEPKNVVNPPEPLEAARRLREVTLDRELLEALAQKIEPVTTPAARVELARRIRAVTEVDTVDGTSYVISFSDSNPERTAAICNQIAVRAAERLPKVLEPRPGTSPEELERQRRTERLMTFLAAHPNAWSAADASNEPKARGTERTDPALAALRVERDRLLAELAQAQAAAAEAASDNPYAESPKLKPEQINARLREVERAIANRRQSLESAQPQASKLSPELQAEWQKLLQDVAQAPPPPPPPPPLKARVTTTAATPGAPVSPNRRRLVGLGAALGFVVGGLGAALSLAGQRGRRRQGSAKSGVTTSSAPPPPAAKPLLTSTLVLEKPPEPVRPTLALPKATTQSAPAPAGPPALGPAGSSAPPPGHEAIQSGDFRIPPARVPTSIAPAPIVQVAAPKRTLSDAPPSPSDAPPAKSASDAPPSPSEAPPAKSASDAPPSPSEAPPAKSASDAPPSPGSNAPRQVPESAAPAAEARKPPSAAPSDAGASQAPSDAAPAAASRPPSDAPPATAGVGSPAKSTPPAGSAREKAGSEPPKGPAALKTSLPPRPEKKRPSVVPTGRDAGASPNRGRSRSELSEPPRASVSPERRKEVDSLHPPFTPPNDDRARLERKVRATPKTLVLGSVITPVVPASRSTPPPPSSSAKQKLQGTGYSHLSSNPPGERELVQARSIPPGWAPDPNVSTDARRELRDKLFPLALEGCFVVVVAGNPDPVESKSRVAAELAVALAKSQHPRVLLLEGNRNRPAVHRLMRVDFGSEGLSRQLESRARGNVAPWVVKRCTETLDVLAEGLNRAPAMMLTPTFNTGVHELKSYYDFIVIDGPFLYDAADCTALSNVVDGVVLVCPDERSRARVENLTPFGTKRFQTVVPYAS